VRRERVADSSELAAADPRAAWEGCVHHLVGLDLGALGAALAAAHAAGHVRSDLTAADVVIAVGMITRPQPEAVLRATPGLPERLVDILIAGMRPTPGRVE